MKLENKTSAILCIAMALGLSAAAATPLPFVPAPPIPLTPDEIAVVTRALGHRLDMEFQSRDEGTYRGRLTLGLTGLSGKISIDEQTGLVVNFSKDYALYSLPQGVPPSDPALSMDAAQAIAISFLQRIGIPHLEGWTLESKEFHAWGGPNSYLRGYSFEWKKVFHGVEMPAFITMNVFADNGEIWDYDLVDDPVTIPIQVNLTGQDAIRIAAQALGWAHPMIKKVDIVIWYLGGYGQGPQTVLWQLEMGNPDALTAADSYVFAGVDAATGKVISLGKPAGMWRKPKPGTSEPPKVALPKPDLKVIPKGSAPPTVFALAAKKKP